MIEYLRIVGLTLMVIVGGSLMTAVVVFAYQLAGPVVGFVAFVLLVSAVVWAGER